VAYTRYAESARVNWVRNFATHIDPQHKKEWLEALTSKGDGLILRSIKTVYKFVSLHTHQNMFVLIDIYVCWWAAFDLAR
jgi:hypothetical protein